MSITEKITLSVGALALAFLLGLAVFDSVWLAILGAVIVEGVPLAIMWGAE